MTLTFKSFADLAAAVAEQEAATRAADRAQHQADIQKAANLRRTRAMRMANKARRAAAQA